MPIDETEEEACLRGVANLDAGTSLVVALIGRMHKSGLVTKAFADDVFYDAKADVLQATRNMANDEAVLRTLAELESLRKAAGLVSKRQV